MIEKTRKFTYPLLKWAYKRRNTDTDAALGIGYRICYLLKEESEAIRKIIFYLIYEKHNPKIYFVIHSPAYPPDTHMFFSLRDNPLMEATFLDADEQHAQHFLSEFYHVIYEF